MKKISLLLAILVICTLITSGYAHPFRLHVIANSNSAEDQEVKLLVRDAVLTATKDGILSSNSKKDAEEYIRKNIGRIEEIAQQTLAKNGESYGAKAMVGIYPFPDKTYGSVIYPAGDYDALKIVLGDGAGKNWWCVMFPPLCIVNTEADTGEKVEYKSFIIEWFEKLFSWEDTNG